MNKLTKYDWGHKCVLVGRVSTSHQSQTAQIEQLKTEARSYGFTETKCFFTTESGFLPYEEKTGWNQVTRFFDEHPDYRVLMVPEMSRLSRLESVLMTIKEFLITRHIQLIIRDIDFALFNEFGTISEGHNLIFNLYASFASAEMAQKKERFKRVLEDYRARGISIGGKELFGYTRIYEYIDGKNRSKYIINTKEAEEIRQVYEWYAFGIDADPTLTSDLKITQKCIEEGFSPYLHSRRNVQKCLKEYAYIGQKETHNRVKNPDYWNYRKLEAPKYVKANSYVCSYPPIFTGEQIALFNKVQERRMLNNSKIKGSEIQQDRSSKHTTLLAKLVRCPGCGRYLCGEYRIKKDARRANSVYRASFTYRCNYSRSAVTLCDFRHAISMPLLDSVIWSYCKRAAFSLLTKESSSNINEQVKDIDKKISIWEDKKSKFNLDDKVSAEKVILRTMMSMAQTSEQRENAMKEFEEHIQEAKSKIIEYDKLILELKNKKEFIKEGQTFISLLEKHKHLSDNKKMLYHILHQLVSNVEIVLTDTNYTICKVEFKQGMGKGFYKDDEYICIYKRYTLNIQVILISGRDIQVENAVKSDKKFQKLDQKFKSQFLAHLPSNKKLSFDKGKFYIDSYDFSIEEVFRYLDLNIEKRLLDPFSIIPISITRMKYEKLDCYQEDWREK